MRIEVTQRETREYYDEILYLANHIKRLRKNPKMKAIGFQKFILYYGIFSVVSILAIFMFYLQFHDIIFIFFMGIMFVLLLFALIVYKEIKSQIQNFLDKEGTIILDINEESIYYQDSEKTATVAWHDIEKVIINRYSVCFLPQKTTNIMITISTDYLDQILQCLKDLHYESLIVNNQK